MTSIPKTFSIKVACASDIHLAHPRTPSQLIVDNLLKAFPDNAETAKLDIIFLAGDVFDRMVQVPEDDAYIARRWVYLFLSVCAKHDIAVRVLEGTPGHDRKQSKMFQEVLDLTGMKVDFKYVEILTIEHMERFGINVLYIPDEWRHDPNETYAEVLQALADRQLDQVDFAIMHGCFEYQLPDVESVRRKAHSSVNYLPLVRYQIFIGHHHVFSQYEHIVAQGSHDRTAHGEEGPKGHVRLTIKDGHKTLTFVENKGAMDYRTISVRDMSITEVNALIASLNLRDGSRIRLSGTISDMGIKALRWVKKDFPQYHFSPPLLEKAVKEDKSVKSIFATYTPVQITRENVGSMVADWLRRHDFGETEVKDCEAYLNEQINARFGQPRTGTVSDLDGNILGN